MVNKERLGAFIDAVVAVVMTIMLLEFEIPKSGSILEFLHANLVYLIAYALSFVYVTTSWFNQQYMMQHAKRITRRIYISCMLWLASLSLLPVLAAWTGRTVNLFESLGLHSPKAPALFFLIMIFLWGIAYVHMTNAFIADNPDDTAAIIQEMEVTKFLGTKLWMGIFAIAIVLTWFYPPLVFVYTAAEMGLAVYRSQNKKERKEKSAD